MALIIDRLSIATSGYLEFGRPISGVARDRLRIATDGYLIVDPSSLFDVCRGVAVFEPSLQAAAITQVRVVARVAAHVTTAQLSPITLSADLSAVALSVTFQSTLPSAEFDSSVLAATFEKSTLGADMSIAAMVTPQLTPSTTTVKIESAVIKPDGDCA